MILISFTIIKI